MNRHDNVTVQEMVSELRMTLEEALMGHTMVQQELEHLRSFRFVISHLNSVYRQLCLSCIVPLYD